MRARVGRFWPARRRAILPMRRRKGTGTGRPAVLEGVNMAVVMPVDLAANPANAECGLTEP